VDREAIAVPGVCWPWNVTNHPRRAAAGAAVAVRRSRPHPVRVGELIAERVTARAAQAAVGASTIPVAGSAIWLALASDHVERPAATAMYRSYLAVAPMLIGLYWWRRRPASRFGPLLVAFGIVRGSCLGSPRIGRWRLISAFWPRGPGTLLTFYLFLAFPSGRLESLADRLLMGAWAVVLGGFFLPWALGSPVIAGGGPLSTCVPAWVPRRPR
jgi:hypothetical protein